jgi:hypothetical protein
MAMKILITILSALAASQAVPPAPDPRPVDPVAVVEVVPAGKLPTLGLPPEIKGEPGTFIAVRAETDAAWVNFKADTGLAVFPSGMLNDRKSTVLTASKAGRYKLLAYTGNVAGGVDAETEIVIGTPEPPVPPVPPTPPTPPVPPAPPSPISDIGLRVLITYSEATKGALPREQLAILASTQLRTYLDAHCVKDAAGDPEWRIIPVTTSFNDDQPIWKKVMALPRGADTWLVVSDGKTGESIPLPPNEPALMEVLKKYEGK